MSREEGRQSTKSLLDDDDDCIGRNTGGGLRVILSLGVCRISTSNYRLFAMSTSRNVFVAALPPA